MSRARKPEGYCPPCKRMVALVRKFPPEGMLVRAEHLSNGPRTDVLPSGIILSTQVCRGSGLPPGELPPNPLFTVTEHEYNGCMPETPVNDSAPLLPHPYVSQPPHARPEVLEQAAVNYAAYVEHGCLDAAAVECD